jgi:hypothetical protein
MKLLGLSIQSANCLEARESPIVKNLARCPESPPQVRVPSTQAFQQHLMQDEPHDSTDYQQPSKDCE